MESQNENRIQKLLQEDRIKKSLDAKWVLENDKEFKIDVNYLQAFLMHDFSSSGRVAEEAKGLSSFYFELKPKS